MNKAVLILLALMALPSVINAQKSFNYQTYKFNVSSAGLNVGDTFTITNIDPKIFSPAVLTDAAGKIWAEKSKKLGATYPYAGGTTPKPGIATFTVVAVPSGAVKAPITTPVTAPLVKSVVTKQVAKIVEVPSAVLQPKLIPAPQKLTKIVEAPSLIPSKAGIIPSARAIIDTMINAIQNNNIGEIKNLVNLKQIYNLSQPEADKLNSEVQNLLKTPEIKNAMRARAQTSTLIELLKIEKKLANPNMNDQQILQAILIDSVTQNDVPVVKYLLETEKVKDVSGMALLAAIADNSFDVVKLLLPQHGAPLTEIALELALTNNNYPISKLLVENRAPISDDARALAQTKTDQFKKLLEQKPPTISGAPVSTGKAATGQEIISVLKALETALTNSNIPAIRSNIEKLPVGSYDPKMNAYSADFINSYPNEVIDVKNAWLAAVPEAQVAFTKAYFAKESNLSYAPITIARETLTAFVRAGIDPQRRRLILGAIKWLLEREKVKDTTGQALETAINYDFYDAAKLLIENGATITPTAKDLALKKGAKYVDLINKAGG
jgi:ankyrin repeat protein